MTAKRILIVEDEKAIRDMVAFGLRRAGYEVREAEDCREARARIVDVRPDLMLVDWMLPDMSGLELTRSLKRAKDTEESPIPPRPMQPVSSQGPSRICDAGSPRSGPGGLAGRDRKEPAAPMARNRLSTSARTSGAQVLAVKCCARASSGRSNSSSSRVWTACFCGSVSTSRPFLVPL